MHLSLNGVYSNVLQASCLLQHFRAHVYEKCRIDVKKLRYARHAVLGALPAHVTGTALPSSGVLNVSSPLGISDGSSAKDWNTSEPSGAQHLYMAGVLPNVYTEPFSGCRSGRDVASSRHCHGSVAGVTGPRVAGSGGRAVDTQLHKQRGDVWAQMLDSSACDSSTLQSAGGLHGDMTPESSVAGALAGALQRSISMSRRILH